MSKKSENKIIAKEAGQQSKPVELNEQQLEMISGGTPVNDKASANLFKLTCTGKHIKEGGSIT